MKLFLLSLVALSVLLTSSCAKMDSTQELIRELKHSDEVVRKEAIHSICDIGPDALTDLFTVLEHENWRVRQDALWAIHLICNGNIVGIRSEAVAGLTPAVRKSLKDSRSDVRMTAATALCDLTFIWGSFFGKKYDGGTSDEGQKAIAALGEALEDEDWRVCFNAAEALVVLRYIEPKGVSSALVKALRNPNYKVRVRAIEGLADVGHLMPDALPRLKHIVAHDDVPWIRGIAQNVIEKIERKLSQ